MKITIRNLQKKNLVYPTRIKKSLLKALKNEGVKRGAITVTFVNDRLISKLNSKYLKEHHPTDVLAFNLSSNPKSKEILGDIIVSVDAARRNSRIYKTTPGYELNLYSLHGCLHLLGYNDNNQKNRKIMRKKELNYANP